MLPAKYTQEVMVVTYRKRIRWDAVAADLRGAIKSKVEQIKQAIQKRWNPIKRHAQALCVATAIGLSVAASVYVNLTTGI